MPLDKVSKQIMETGFYPTMANMGLNPNNMRDIQKYNSLMYDFRQNIQNATKNIDAMGNSMDVSFSSDAVSKGTITMDNFGRIAGEAAKKVAVWQIAIAAVYGVMHKVSETIVTWKELETTLSRISITTSAVGDSLYKYFKDVAAVAIEFGMPINQTLNGMDLALRATAKYGESAERAAVSVRLLKDASILANLTGMQYSQSIDILVGSLRQTGLDLDSGLTLLNKWTAVSKNAAVNVNDLSQTFAIMAEAGKAAGMTIDQMNGIVAALSETVTQSPTELGNTIRGLMSTLYNEGSIKLLEKYGVAAKTSTGDLRGFWDVMLDLSALKELNVLNDAQWLEIAKAAGAGQRNYAKFLALLGNIPTAVRTATISQEAQNDAITANEKIVDTLANSWDKFTASQDKLSMALGSETGIINDLSNALKNLAKIFDWVSNADTSLFRLAKTIMVIVASLGALKLASKVPMWLGITGEKGMLGGITSGIRNEVSALRAAVSPNYAKSLVKPDQGLVVFETGNGGQWKSYATKAGTDVLEEESKRGALYKGFTEKTLPSSKRGITFARNPYVPLLNVAGLSASELEKAQASPLAYGMGTQSIGLNQKVQYLPNIIQGSKGGISFVGSPYVDPTQRSAKNLADIGMQTKEGQAYLNKISKIKVGFKPSAIAQFEELGRIGENDIKKYQNEVSKAWGESSRTYSNSIRIATTTIPKSVDEVIKIGDDRIREIQKSYKETIKYDPWRNVKTVGSIPFSMKTNMPLAMSPIEEWSNPQSADSPLSGRQGVDTTYGKGFRAYVADRSRKFGTFMTNPVGSDSRLKAMYSGTSMMGGMVSFAANQAMGSSMAGSIMSAMGTMAGSAGGIIGMAIGGVAGKLIGDLAADAFISKEDRIKKMFSGVADAFSLDLKEIVTGKKTAPMEDETDAEYRKRMIKSAPEETPADVYSKQWSNIENIVSRSGSYITFGGMGAGAFSKSGEEVLKSANTNLENYRGVSKKDWEEGYGALTALKYANKQGLITDEVFAKALGRGMSEYADALLDGTLEIEDFIKLAGNNGVAFGELTEGINALLPILDLRARGMLSEEQASTSLANAMKLESDALKRRQDLAKEQTKQFTFQKEVKQLAESTLVDFEGKSLNLVEWERANLDRLNETQFSMSDSAYESAKSSYEGISKSYPTYKVSAKEVKENTKGMLDAFSEIEIEQWLYLTKYNSGMISTIVALTSDIVGKTRELNQFDKDRAKEVEKGLREQNIVVDIPEYAGNENYIEQMNGAMEKITKEAGNLTKKGAIDAVNDLLEILSTILNKANEVESLSKAADAATKRASTYKTFGDISMYGDDEYRNIVDHLQKNKDDFIKKAGLIGETDPSLQTLFNYKTGETTTLNMPSKALEIGLRDMQDDRKNLDIMGTSEYNKVVPFIKENIDKYTKEAERLGYKDTQLYQFYDVTTGLMYEQRLNTKAVEMSTRALEENTASNEIYAEYNKPSWYQSIPTVHPFPREGTYTSSDIYSKQAADSLGTVNTNLIKLSDNILNLLNSILSTNVTDKQRSSLQTVIKAQSGTYGYGERNGGR
jgi:TP901 family phage tail tape measure protein